MSGRLPIVVGLLVCTATGPSSVAIADVEVKEPPRLILQITVDQLRGDLPLRHRELFGEGGFRTCKNSKSMVL